MYQLNGVMYSAEEIKAKVVELAKQIEKDYAGEELLVVGILKGASVFCADLIREIDLDVKMDFMVVSSYGSGTTSSGTVKIIKDLDVDIENKNVIIVEDIVDSGRTIAEVTKIFKASEVNSIAVATLLDKPEMRLVEGIHPKYIGFEVPNKFVVGFGLDYNQKYRNLPYIGVLKPEIYEK